MAERAQRMTFLAELESKSTDAVRFRYPIDGSAAIVLPREWWEQLQRPESIEVTVEPQRDD